MSYSILLLNFLEQAKSNLWIKGKKKTHKINEIDLKDINLMEEMVFSWR